MPPAAAIGGAVAAGVLAGAGAAIGGTVVFGLSVTLSAVLIGVATAVLQIGLTMLMMSMAPKPSMPKARDRTASVRQPITPWRIVYGYTRSSGPMTFVEGTNGNNNLHMIVTLACHEIDYFSAVQLDDYFIYRDNLDANGHVLHGKYAGKVRIKFHVGTDDQEADAALLDETSAVATDRGQGRAYIYIRLAYDADIFVGALPSISCWMFGKKLYDPRTGLTAFSNNPALMMRDYITRELTLGGVGVSSDSIEDTVLQSTANSNEEFVSVTPTEHVTFPASVVVDTTNDCIEFRGDVISLVGLTLGDRVTVAVSDYAGDAEAGLPAEPGVMPTGLSAATNYFVIPFREHKVVSLPPFQYTRYCAIKLAATYADALARNAINITAAGTGTLTLERNAEPRYAAAGIVDLDSSPAQILDNIRGSMAGRVYFIGGKWCIKTGVYTAPTWELTERDLRRGPSFQTKVSRRDRFNAVRGSFLSPENFWQEDEYPILLNPAYELQDGGVRIFTTLDMPFAFKPFTCQRIAKIEPERMRREITVTLPCKITAFQVKAGDSILVTLDRYGWAQKEFEIIEWQLATDEDETGTPYLCVDLSIREIDSGVFDWSASEEGAFVPRPRTNLPNPFEVTAPGAPIVVESTYNTRDGAGVKAKVTLTWEASSDAFVTYYRPEYKLNEDADWIQMPSVSHDVLTVDLFDVNPGIYDFRIVAINMLGSTSAASEATTREIFGLLAPPTAPQGLTMVGMGGLAVIRWDVSPDLDVLNGGFFEFRHSPAEIGAVWEESVTIGNVVPGYETVGIFPLKPGTYLAKAVDSMLIKSVTPTTVTTAGSTVLTYTTLNEIIEEPSFSGTHDDTAAVDSVLKLSGAGLWDSITDVDALTTIDTFGGTLLSGTYTFSTLMDLGSVQKVRIRTTIAVLIVNILDMFDERDGNLDDWDTFDGTEAGDADAQVWVCVTDDDPNAAPVWSEYQRAESAEFECRGLQFQCRLSTTDPAYNIEVSTLQVKAEQVV